MPSSPDPTGRLGLRVRADEVGQRLRADYDRSEARLPAALAVVFAAAMHGLLPQSLLFAPRWTVSAVELALLVPLIAINPRRLTEETRVSRWIELGLTAVIIAGNLVSLALLLRDLTESHVPDGRVLLLAALQVFATNIIAFALVYWSLDRGGAVARAVGVGGVQPDFQFVRDTDPPETGGRPGWRPTFVDYLYLSITNSTAFSTTDTLPLTGRAKMIMALEGLSAMVTATLVIARAVNILS